MSSGFGVVGALGKNPYRVGLSNILLNQPKLSTIITSKLRLLILATKSVLNSTERAVASGLKGAGTIGNLPISGIVVDRIYRAPSVCKAVTPAVKFALATGGVLPKAPPVSINF